MDKTTEEVWKEYHKQLLGFISSKVSNKQMAKDILHEVFIKIHSKMHTLNDFTKLKSWIYQITRNTIIDFYRTNKDIKEIPDWVEKPFEIDSDERINEELSLCLEFLIEKLPSKYKNAIQLTEIENKSQQELANDEQISLSGAKSRVQRGRKILKEMLLECCELEINKHNRIVEVQIKDEKNCDLLK
ncbi:RNA polymerase sigma factor SigZ [Halarcobacter sp.]|uniref:RNA polymerase sigma factor SigZ n=1 Tax=Halarcobacter sp. TaxID=2321133 RepID=UPI003AFFFF20